MTTLNLGQDWELRADAANNRLLAEYTPNEIQFEMNEDGTLRPLNGGIDLGGADITNVGSVSTEDLATADRDADIIIKKDESGAIKAIGDESQGEIASGSSLSSVFASARDALTSGRDYKEKILIKGDYTLSNTLVPKDYLILELRGSIELADGVDADMVKNADHSSGNTELEIVGGTWNGNRANNTDGSGDIFNLHVNHLRIHGVTGKNAAKDFINATGGNSAILSENIGDNCFDEAFNIQYADGVIQMGDIAKNCDNGGFHPTTNGDMTVLGGCVAFANGINYHLYDNENVILSNCHGDRPDAKNVLVSETAKRCRISGTFRNAGTINIHVQDTAGSAEECVIDVTAIGAEEQNVRIENAPGTIVRGVIKESKFSNIEVRSEDVRLMGVSVGNSSESFANPSQYPIRIMSGANACKVVAPVFESNTRLISFEADDCAILHSPDMSFSQIDATGARPVWNGVIGGGQLRGVDIGSITNVNGTQIARSDGTTGDQDAHYQFLAGGDWQALHDPTTTITPS